MALFFIIGIVLLAGFVTWAIPIYDILKSKQTTTWMLGWIVVVMALPFVGALLYFAAGRKQGK